MTPKTRLFLAPLGAFVLALGIAACGNDDDTNGDLPDLPTVENNGDGVGNGNGDGIGNGNDHGELQDRFDDLQQEFENASDETQDALGDLWNEIESAFEDAQDSDDDGVRQEFEDLADQLEEQLNDLTLAIA